MTDAKKTVTVVLDSNDAWNLALFLKRVTFDEIRANAQDADEADAIRTAIAHTQALLAEGGVAPR